MAEHIRIALVDDDEGIRRLVERRLSRAGYEIASFDCGEALRQRMYDDFEAVLLDVGLPDTRGFELLDELRDARPRLPVLMLTGNTEVESVVEAMQHGAFDYIAKPIDWTRLTTLLRHAVTHHQQQQRIAQLEGALGQRNAFGMIGESKPMQRLYREISHIAKSDVTALIQGESGTGKELIARAIHEHSSRASGPFVAINCAAIPESLQESELFGHEKGAFTGAGSRKAGRFEQADGGTLFLDELAELSLSLQAKLLRVLQERRFFRVGGDREITSDFRLVAATHKDLRAAVRDGRFRQDLFFRIAVFELHPPPLRERASDIAQLARHFASTLTHHTQVTLSPEAMHLLERYAWPGNVRELRNALERALVVCNGDTITPEDLPLWLQNNTTPTPTTLTPALTSPPLQSSSTTNGGTHHHDSDDAMTSLADAERITIERILERVGGNVSRAARELKIGRSTLYRKMKRYGIRAD